MTYFAGRSDGRGTEVLRLERPDPDGELLELELGFRAAAAVIVEGHVSELRRELEGAG